MAYTTIDKPSDYFNTVLWTGNSSSDSANQTITGVGFQPDFFWTKVRSHADAHQLRNVIQGNTTRLASNSNIVENTSSCSAVPNADGFVITGDDGTEFNSDGKTYVSWNWKAGTAFTNDASATGIGSIDSSGSVSTDAGFSIISYTGTGSAATVAHGLGVAPKMIHIKNRTTARNWISGHESIGWTKNLYLEATNAVNTETAIWNDTAPTSSVFSIGSSVGVNQNTDSMIAYCFSEVKGYSKFGSYVGTGVDSGTFSFCGFKPSFVLTKRTDSAGSWVIQDNKRPGYNETSLDLNPNVTEAEESNNGIDMLSNGFKQRNTDAHTNASGGNYIFYAVAESPFVTSTGVPATAR